MINFTEEYLNNGEVPCVLIWTGQSNAVGYSEPMEGDTTINEGVYIWNDQLNSFIVPEFGVYPLPDTQSNNASIHCANLLNSTLNRNIYIILSAVGGLSIEKWVGIDDFMWTDIQSKLNNSGVADIPNSVIGIGWMQGEADSSTVTTGYNTYDSYKGGFISLVDRFRNLPCVGGGCPIIASGLGEWKENGASARNDVFSELSHNDMPSVSSISTHNLFPNLNQGSSHFNGESLVKIGKRIALSIISSPIKISTYRPMKVYLPMTGATIFLEPMDLKNSAMLIVNNSTIKLPLAFRYTGSRISVLVTSITSGYSYIDASPQGIRVNNVQYSIIALDKVGIWEFISINGRLHLVVQP